MSRLFNNTPDRQPITDWQCERMELLAWGDPDADQRDRAHRRIEVALTMLIVFALVVWIAAR